MLRSTSSRFVAGAALMLSVLGSSAAHAGDEAAAEQLFQEGMAAMKKNDFVPACEAFAASNKADPSPGTQINLAVCYEKQHKWASAWAWYRSAATLAEQRGQGDRATLANKESDRIRPQLHYVTISLQPAVEGASFKRDGEPVTTSVGGREIALPFDPGEHALEVNAPKKKPFTKTIKVGEAAAQEKVVLGPMEDAPEDKPVGGTGGGTVGDYRPPVVVSNDGSGQRTVGIIVGGVGILAGVASVPLFLLAGSEASARDDERKKQAAATNADEQKSHDDSAISHDKAASRNQLIAFSLLGGGVVLIGVGAVLYLTAPKSSSTTGKVKPRLLPVVAPGYGGLSFGGTF